MPPQKRGGPNEAHSIAFERALSAVCAFFKDLKTKKALALAVSGGPDSMALMHLVRRWCDIASYDFTNITILTVDHGLRSSSRLECEKVREDAFRLGFPNHRTLVWETAKTKHGLQEAARHARYQLMLNYCISHEIPCLVTAHTQDDQAETVLMRLARGSGLDGLSGIPACSFRNGIELLRPLLSVSKAELLDFLKLHAIEFVNDPTNANPHFERTRIRQALQILQNEGISHHVLAQSAKRLSMARQALESITERILHEATVIHPLGFATLNAESFRHMPFEVALRVLSRILDLIGGDAPAVRRSKLERAIEQGLFWQKPLTLAGCFIVYAPPHIKIYRELGRMKDVSQPLVPGQNVVFDKRFSLRLKWDEATEITVQPLGIEGWNAYRSSLVKDKPSFDRRASLTTPALCSGGRLVYAPLLKWPLLKESTLVKNLSITLTASLRPFLKAEEQHNPDELGK